MNMLLVLALAALVVVPGGHASIFAGPPLSLVGRLLLTLALGLAVFLWLFRPARIARPWMVALVALLAAAKIGAGLASQPVGWQGVYELLDSRPPAIGTFFERFRAEGFRVDPRIDFDGASFRLHFLNDARRYGFETSRVPPDQRVPLRISWTGHLELPEAMDVTVSGRVRGRFTVSVDGRPMLDGVPEAGASATAHLGKGGHVVNVVYEKPPDTVPLARVAVTDSTTGAALSVAPRQRAGGASLPASVLAGVTTALVTAGALVAIIAFIWIYGGRAPASRYPAQALAALALFGAVSVLLLLTWWLAVPFPGRTEFLWSGGDPLIYESNARNVMREGLLMPGAAEGPGRPFYFYPLYAYALAGAHWVIGDDVGAAVLLNGWLLSCLLPLFWVLGWHALPLRAAIVAVAVGTFFVGRRYMPYSRAVFTDSLYVVTVFAAILAATRMLRSGRSGAALLAGVVSAMAAATRPSFMTFLPLLLAAFLVMARERTLAERLRLSAWAAAGLALGLLPFALRNSIISGHFVPLVNSWIQIPYFLIPPEAANPVGFVDGRPPTLGESLSTALQIFRDQPWRTLSVELRKIGMTLGFTNLGHPGSPLRPELPLIALGGAVALWRRVVPRTTEFVLSVFAVSHVAAMIIAAPWTGGFKNILPLHAVLLFMAAFLMAPRAGDARDSEVKGA